MSHLTSVSFEKNPLLQKNTLDLNAIPWDKIKIDHFKDALIAEFKEAKKQIEKVLNSTADSNFNNTILVLNDVDSRLMFLDRLLSVLEDGNSNRKNIDNLNRMLELAKKLHTDLMSSIYTHPQLFHRVHKIYENRENFRYDQKLIIESVYNEFIKNGVDLKESDKQKLIALQHTLNTKKREFSKRYRASRSLLIVIKDISELKGVPNFVLETTAQDAQKNDIKGTAWAFTNLNISHYVLKYAENPKIRQRFWEEINTVGADGGPNDTRSLVKEIVAIRHQIALILGYKTFAEYQLRNTMAQNPDRVQNFLSRILEENTDSAQEDLEIVRQRKVQDTRITNDKLYPWDIAYYANKLKKEKFSFDTEVVKKYFRVDKVLNGAFTIAQKLFNVEFKKRTDLPVYHSDVEIYEVTRDGKSIGLVYVDLYQRTSLKRPGAWANNIQRQGEDPENPRVSIASLNLNIVKKEDGYTFLSPADVRSLFHELGHNLHYLLSDVAYHTQAGTTMSRDFTELPSKFMEHYAWHKASLELFATNDEGEVIPQELIDYLMKSSNFLNAENNILRVERNLLDMGLHHTRGAQGIDDLEEFEKEVRAPVASFFYSDHPFSLMSVKFRHIFISTYEAEYYSYLWSEQLAADVFNFFLESGDIFSPYLAKELAKMLAAGSSIPPHENYNRFKQAVSSK